MAVQPGPAALWIALLGAPAPTAAEWQAVDALAQVRLVAQGQMVFDRGQSAQSLVALAQGEVGMGLHMAGGGLRIERIVRGPAWLDLSSGWLGEPHALDAQAMAAATIVELPTTALLNVLAVHAGLAPRLIRELAREVQALAVHTHELMHKDAPARLAQWLSQRCQPTDQPGQALVKLADRKRDVASQLAITPETLSRLMRSFTRQGVIQVSGYLVRVLDVAALERLAQA